MPTLTPYTYHQAQKLQQGTQAIAIRNSKHPNIQEGQSYTIESIHYLPDQEPPFNIQISLKGLPGKTDYLNLGFQKKFPIRARRKR